MKNTKLCKYGFLHSLGVVIYIVLVALFMSNGEKIFGSKDTPVVSAVAFVLLFTLSASVVGGLVLGKPIMMFLAGDKKESVKLFSYTVLWMLGWLLLTFGILILV